MKMLDFWHSHLHKYHEQLVQQLIWRAIPFISVVQNIFRHRHIEINFPKLYYTSNYSHNNCYIKKNLLNIQFVAPQEN